MKKNISKVDDILLDLLNQSCGVGTFGDNEYFIDNNCISCYEEACDFLTEKGYLKTLDGRIYKLTHKARTL